MKKRLLSLFLTVIMLVQFASTALAAVIHGEDETISILDENGNVVESGTMEEWEEKFPYGMFAFKETQVNLKEGATDGSEKGVLTVYRIGGTKGRATALVTLTPAITQIEEDRLSYANAAGAKDYKVTVEDSWAIAEYQRYGDEAAGILPGDQVYYEDGVYFKAPSDEAENVQWQIVMLDTDNDGVPVGDWADIEGANAIDLTLTFEDVAYIFEAGYEYDIRCFYDLEGQRYCATSWYNEEVYVPEPVEELTIPEDFTDDRSRRDYELIFDGEEYNGYSFIVDFAEDEWEKEITFEAINDELHESAEVVSVVITDAKGAEINMSACTASVAIQDDEPEIPSEMGFSAEEIWADKSHGSVRIPLYRVSEGLQYVVGADYTTVDGTAVAGRDYAVNTSMAVFVSDLDHTYIDIELVNDMIPLAKEESELYFKVVLTTAKGGGSSTLADGKTEITVRLYNSAEDSEDQNVATDLYSPDEEDVTDKVEQTGSIVAPGKTIYASTKEKPEDVELSYYFGGESDTGASAFAYSYPGKLNVSGLKYSSNSGYWGSKAIIAGAYGTDLDADNHEGYHPNSANSNLSWTFRTDQGVFNEKDEDTDDLWGVNGSSWKYTTQRHGYMQLKVANLYDRYSHFYYKVTSYSDESWELVDEDYSNVYFKYIDSDENMNHFDPVVELCEAKKNKENTTENTIEIKSSHRGYAFQSDYHGPGVDYDAQSSSNLSSSYFVRRSIPAPVVRIHTADDDLLASNDVTKQLFNTIKPKITAVAGKSGTPDNNKLFNNSQISVQRSDTAGTYGFATTANGALGNSLFYSKENMGSLFSLSLSSLSSSEKGSMTLLHKKDECGNQGYINVVMDRKQKFNVDISPSVPRKADSTEIDSSKIGATWDKFWDEANITYTYKEGSWNNNIFKGFTTKNGTVSTELSKVGNTLYSTIALKNVSGICFNLDPDDIILHNGIVYKGNDTIPISPDMFLATDVYFYYYAEEYVKSVSTMLANVTRTERYIDINDDGLVKGTMDANGSFVPDSSEKEGVTFVTLPSLIKDQYSITDLAPREGPDGKYHQIVLKTYYSLIPRALEAAYVDGASESDTCEIIPAAITAVTENKQLAKMSDDQRQYRYIDHGTTGNGHLMYGGIASKEAFVDIPLGGDHNPGTADSNGIVTWNPDWRGNPYPGTEFAPPQPIFVDGTVLGDSYPIGDLITDDDMETTGPVVMLEENIPATKEVLGPPSTSPHGTLTPEGETKVNAYLFSLQENDTLALCVREEEKTSAASFSTFANDDIGYAPAEHTLARIESATLGKFKTFPSTVGARNLSDPLGTGDPNSNPNKNAGFDSSEAKSEMPEYNMGGTIAMPELDIGLTDFVSIALNGQEIAISAGADLFGFSKSSKVEDQKANSWNSKEVGGPVEQNEEKVNNIKQLISTFTDRVAGDGIGKLIDDKKQEYKDQMRNAKSSKSAKPAGKDLPGISIAGFEVSLAVNVTLLLKWNPIENQFFFNKLMVTLAVGVEFSYTVRLTPCPILYCTITIGFNLEVMAGLEASRVKVKKSDANLKLNSGGWIYYDNQKKFGSESSEEGPMNDDFSVGAPGTKFSVTTKEKALDIHFNGKLYVEAKDANGNAPKGFKAGTIKSDGEDPVTIKLAEKVDGKDNSKAYTVTFTVVDDDGERMYHKVSYTSSNKKVVSYDALPKGYAIVDRIVTIDKQTHDVYFTGINISPELFMEVAVGIGCELLSVELFINITVGCSFAIYSHDSEDYAGEDDKDKGFDFNEFNFLAGVGFRISSLFFNLEFNAVQFAITYDRLSKHDEHSQKNSGWNYIWYAANQPVKKYSLLDEDSDDGGDVLTMNIILPGELVTDEKLFSPEDNVSGAASTFAYDPTDSSVPFQYSGYGTSGDAFALGDDMMSGSTYELITANGKNYIAYTVTDTAADSINQSRLVLSEVRETAKLDGGGQPTGDSAYGLDHPFGESGKYLMIDDDATGDLDFDIWTDNDGNINIAWISYSDEALDAYNTALLTGEIEAMAAAGRNTVVKTVEIDLSAKAAGPVNVISEGENGHGMYLMPKGTTNASGRDMIFYGEVNYYAPEELESLLQEYKDYYGELTYSSNGSLYYGEGTNPSSNFQYNYKRMRLEVYGKSFYPTFAVSSPEGYKTTRVEAASWTNDGVQIDNASLTAIDNDYYIAYSTVQTSLQDTEEQTIKKLYLQKAGIDAESGKPSLESAVALRKLVDYSKDSALDGIYTSGSVSELYEDPYFANVKFLKGKLGELTGDAENFEEIIEMLPFSMVENENFLIFEMNGNTFVIPEADLEGIVTSHTGRIIPFFTRETAEEINRANEESEYIENYVEAAPAVTNVTFGADGNGNISAVYLQSVPNAPGNAIYLTKYDPESKTWGVGTMLAMADMQTFEDSEAEEWSVDETITAYYDTNNNNKLDEGDSPQSFSFNKLSIGLAGEDKLLVVSEGVLMQLEAVPYMKGSYSTEGALTGIEPVEENGDVKYTFNAKQSVLGGYESKTGVYALSFGMGNQALSSASLVLSNYLLTPGSDVTAHARFTNGGDVAIRASKANPATVELLVMSGDQGQSLAKWEITETIRSGQKVITEATTVTLPASIAIGDKLYFAVYEDPSYVTNPFHQTTITQIGEPDTPACITVAKKAELGYESFDISMAGADQNSVTLAANIHVGNRGSADSTETYLRFQYSKKDADGITVYSPVDLTGHKLSVSEQKPLQTFDLDAKTLANGYLLLQTTENGVAVTDQEPGWIKSMHGRTVTGTFKVPKTLYDTEFGSGSLNLTVTIESYASNDGSTPNEGEVIDEYNAANNISEISVEQKTIFSTVSNFNAQVGSSLRLPIEMQTSMVTAGTQPVVTVTEFPNDATRNIGVLYYDSNRNAIVAMPTSEGEGKIRIADEATNSFFDICYSIDNEGVGINIFNDNGIFTWYDKNGNSGQTGTDAWQFRQALNWSDTLKKAPLRSDLAIANKDEYFTFQTQATKIDFFFMGNSKDIPADIKVSSNLSGFSDKTISSSDGSKAVSVDFENDGSANHTVTVKALSDEVRFDKIIETYESDREIKNDPTAPGIYFSRSPLPETSSIKQGESLTLYVWFADLEGLQSVTVNGKTPTLTKGEFVWEYQFNISENGSYVFIATDTSGNVTTRELTVDWFDASIEATTDTPAPSFSLTSKVESGVQSISTDLENETTTVTKLSYNNPTDPTLQYFKLYAESDAEQSPYPISGGVYRIETTVDGVTGYRIKEVAQADATAPIITIDKAADGKSLVYTVSGGSVGGQLAEVTSLYVNTVEQLNSSTAGYNVSGNIPISGFGNYVFEARDSNSRTTVAGYNLSFATVSFTPGTTEVRTSMAPQTVTNDTTYVKPNEYRRDGYTFVGWSYAPDSTVDIETDEYIPINFTDITLYAVWEINEYTITFNTDGGNEIQPIVQDYKTPVTAPQDPEKTGYTFAGWDIPIPSAMPAENLEITALWDINQYTVTFDTDGGNEIQPIIQDYKTPVTAPPDPEKTGYTFIGWDKPIPTVMPAENTLITALWSINRYNVTVVSSDDKMGSVSGNTNQDYNTSAVITASPKANYMLEGWYKDNDTASSSTDLDYSITIGAGDAVYTAKFQLDTLFRQSQKDKAEDAANKAKADIDALPAINPIDSAALKNEVDAKLAAANDALDNAVYIEDTEEALVLLDDELSEINKDAKYINDTSIYVAVIRKLRFNTNGGTLIAERPYAVNSTVQLDKFTTVKNGYEFTGWYADEALTQRITKITMIEHETVWAGWKASPNAPITPSVPDTPADVKNIFKDVDKDDWFYEAVMKVYEKGLMLGVASDLFGPYINTQRGMIVTVLYRLEGEPAFSGKHMFNDVSDKMYYDKAISWASENGIVNGYGDGRFGPEDYITREQLATILYRYAEYKGYNTSIDSEKVLNTFSDSEKISTWAKKGLEWAADKKIVGGKENSRLDPTGLATRAETAAMLIRFTEAF